jgi:hypothetical protein
LSMSSCGATGRCMSGPESLSEIVYAVADIFASKKMPSIQLV